MGLQMGFFDALKEVRNTHNFVCVPLIFPLAIRRRRGAMSSENLFEVRMRQVGVVWVFCTAMHEVKIAPEKHLKSQKKSNTLV